MILHSFDELNSGTELRPPILVFTGNPLTTEASDVLDCGQQCWWVALKRENKMFYAHMHNIIQTTWHTCKKW